MPCHASRPLRRVSLNKSDKSSFTDGRYEYRGTCNDSEQLTGQAAVQPTRISQQLPLLLAAG